MTLFDALTRPLRRFRSDSRGSASVELVIVLPLLLWGLAATVVFFDGYKARYHAEMAAQTVADIMSRETDLFTANYVEGLNNVFDFLADARYPTRIRVSSVIWDPTNNRNRLQWSYGTRGLSPLPTNTFELLQAGDTDTLQAEFGNDQSFSFTGALAQMPISDLANRIPPVLPGEALLMVETFALWSPFASVGIGQLRFTPVVVVRPRFAPWVNFDGIDPIFPEADYEITWTGGGNTDLPDPNDPDPVDTGPTDTTYSFDNGVTTNWSSSTITSGGPSGGFLGLFASETWANPVTLAVDLNTAGQNATIAFDLIIADSWDGFTNQWILPRGDIFQVLIDGTPISWDPMLAWDSPPYSNDRISTGYLNGMTYRVAMTRTRNNGSFVGTATADSLWRVTISLENAPRRFQLGFSAGINSGVDDESFGLDNVSISASGTGSVAPFIADPALLRTPDPHTRFPRYSGCPDPRIAAPWLSMTRSDLTTGIIMTREAGGDTNLNGCRDIGGARFADASPQLVLNYDNQGVADRSGGLSISMEDGNNGRTCDTTLIMRDPSGQWWFNDDRSGWNAGLRVTNPASGQYVIFIGSYANTACTSALSIGRF